jgi:small-conductance mechanosensitive channel
MELLTELWQDITSLFVMKKVLVVARTLLVAVVGLMLARLLAVGVQRLLTRRASPHRALVYRHLTYYFALGLVVIGVLHTLGVEPTVLLGAAGVLTVAFGFAAQTSASNIISGLFLMGEKPFEVGDFIKVGETTGQVLSIDMLSVKMRTYDNLFVRVPNESLLKSEITNFTRHPIRRLDIQIGVSLRADTNQVRRVLRQVAENENLVLNEPKPLFLFLGFGENAINLQFSVWVTRENFWEVMAPFKRKVRAALKEGGIEIPYPQRSLSTDVNTAPFPVRIVEDAPAQQPPAPIHSSSNDRVPEEPPQRT